MIPMFRTLARSAMTSVATCELLPSLFFGLVLVWLLLPAVVREGLVRFGHLVGIFAALDARAEAIAGVEQFVHQALGHRLLAASLGVADDPTQGESAAAGALDFHRDLVGGATNATALDLERGPHVVEGALQRDHRVGAGRGAAALELSLIHIS